MKPEEQELSAHVAVCEERYKNIIEHLDSIEKRLSENNSRAWKAYQILIRVLGLGCISMIAYIWAFRVGP